MLLEVRIGVLIDGGPMWGSKGEHKPMRELDLERYRARYGLLAVVLSNFSIVTVAIVGVWQLGGDKSVIVGVLTAAFTAVSSMTTAYLGIKAVSNTAKSIALGDTSHRTQAPAQPTETPVPASQQPPGPQQPHND